MGDVKVGEEVCEVGEVVRQVVGGGGRCRGLCLMRWGWRWVR